MTRKRLTIIGIIGLVVLAILLTLLTAPKKLKQLPIYKASATAANIQFPYLANKQTIDFFTGTNFAAYNTKTGTTTSISPQFNLPTVSAVHWSKTGALFEASDYSVADDLYQALLNKNQDPSQEYWWLYSFSTQKVTLVLPSNPTQQVVDAYWNSSGSNYAYITNTNNLYTSDAPNKSLYKTIDGARIKQFTHNAITLTANTALEQFNTQTRQVKTLINTDFQDSYVSADGQTIAYVLNTHPQSNGVTPGDLYIYNPTTGKSHKLLSGFDGVMSGSGGNLYIAYTDTNGGLHFNVYPHKGKAVSYSLGAVLQRGDTSLNEILPVTANEIYLDTNMNNLVLASTQPTHKSNPINNTYLIQSDLYLNGFEIHYSPENNNYQIVIDQNPYSQYQAAALAYIQSKQVDPNQIVIRWIADDGVTDVNPAVDTTSINFE
jgi:hypothetical protein